MDNIQKTWFNSTTKTIVIDPINAAAFAADISNCKLDGSADEIQRKFDTAKYQACQLHTNNEKIFTGRIQLGNTKLSCEAVADSNIIKISTQPTATQLTEEQSAQAIQPTAVGES